MKKQPLLKREIALMIIAAISLLLVVISVVYITNLQHTIANNNRMYSSTLTAKSNELNEQVNYIDTVCGEYRKLYDAYKGLSAHESSIGGVGYALPGSAKGEIDTCYQSP